MIVLPSSWQQQWRGQDYFDVVLSLQGEEYRNMDGRRTFRFEKDGRGYFAKVYTGLGWKRILKSLLTLRRPPVLSAANEWRAIRRLETLGVDTMTLVGYGERGTDPARRQSFIITEELTPTESLEDFCHKWPQEPPAPALKRALIDKLAQISRQLHDNGVNHRDYYLCHFLLNLSVGRENLRPDGLDPVSDRSASRSVPSSLAPALAFERPCRTVFLQHGDRPDAQRPVSVYHNVHGNAATSGDAAANCSAQAY